MTRNTTAAAAAQAAGGQLLAAARNPAVIDINSAAAEMCCSSAGGVLVRVTVPRSWTDRGQDRSRERLDVGSLSALDTLVKLLGAR